MNEACLLFDAKIENEPFARCVVASFIARLNPTMDELVEIKTVVSEAVANAITHGYDGQEGKVEMNLNLDNRTLSVTIKDEGLGIEDISKALQPLYTTKAHLERSGMGMTIMESLSDDFKIDSEVGKGTRVTIVKRLKEVSIHESDH